MKAIILAAGIGVRLKPLTEDKPKCLLIVGGKSLIKRIVENLYRENIVDISIVMGYKKEMVIKVFLLLAKHFNLFYHKTNEQ